MDNIAELIGKVIGLFIWIYLPYRFFIKSRKKKKLIKKENIKAQESKLSMESTNQKLDILQSKKVPKKVNETIEMARAKRSIIHINYNTLDGRPARYFGRPSTFRENPFDVDEESESWVEYERQSNSLEQQSSQKNQRHHYVFKEIDEPTVFLKNDIVSVWYTDDQGPKGTAGKRLYYGGYVSYFRTNPFDIYSKTSQWVAFDKESKDLKKKEDEESEISKQIEDGEICKICLKPPPKGRGNNRRNVHREVNEFYRTLKNQICSLCDVKENKPAVILGNGQLITKETWEEDVVNIKFNQIATYLRAIPLKSQSTIPVKHHKNTFYLNFECQANRGYLIFQSENNLGKRLNTSLFFRDRTIADFQMERPSQSTDFYRAELSLECLNALKTKQLEKWRFSHPKQDVSWQGFIEEDCLVLFGREDFVRILMTYASHFETIMEENIPSWKDGLDVMEDSEKPQSNNKSKASECFVYLMKDTSNGYYKIGISSKPEYREKTLQSEKPTIDLIETKSYPSREMARAIELALHNLFKEKRLRGEWFSLDDTDVQHVKESLR
jgi:predicted GIY-YIG superfamily endonuclease